MQYKEKLQKNGLTEAELTPRIKSVIADLKEAVKEKAELEKDLQEENYEDEDQKEEMQSALAEVNELIAEQDAEVSEKITLFAKNKRARDKKVDKAPSQPKPASSNKTPETGTIVVNEGGSISSTDQKSDKVSETTTPEEPKKSGNGILWGLLGVGALVLTLGTVNLFSGDE